MVFGLIEQIIKIYHGITTLVFISVLLFTRRISRKSSLNCTRESIGCVHDKST